MAEEKSQKRESSKKHDDLIATAKKRFAIAEELEKDIRTLALEDWKFRAGEQWPENVKADREADGRPTLVINKVLQNIRHITNDQRQNRPSIKIHPVDDNADIETAKILQGMVRHIEQDSGADVAYDTAFEGAAVGGFGYLRVYTEYVDATSFEQQIKIGQIENAFSVFFDPNAKNPDGSDANWAFIIDDIPKEDYIAEYGESKLADSATWDAQGLADSDWVSKDSCRIAEYFYKEYKIVKVFQLSTGQVIEESELETALAELFPNGLPVPIEELIINKKTAKVPVIKWAKLNGMEVLEETEWPGKWIPIIPVYGDKLNIDGKRILEGIVRHAKDPSRMYNYFKSSEAEVIGLAPKAPYMLANGQIPKGYEGMWQTANKKSHAFLLYEPTEHEGKLVPPPQRNFGEANTQSITQAAVMAGDDIKGTTGVYDGAMGAPSNETSGKAILARGAQAQTSNFHLVDNLTRSIRHVGRILIDLIPKIYDTARAIRILGEEGNEEVVRINQEFIYKGQKVHFKTGAGKYDVSVDTGPSFATKRQEARETMLAFVQADPSASPIIRDLIAKNSDWPGSQEIAERFKKMLPPGVADDPNKAPIPPEAQAQIQEMSQMIEQLTQTTSEQAEQIKQKTLELESKERIEMAKLENQLIIEQMKLSANPELLAAQRQLAELQAQQDFLGMHASRAAEAATQEQVLTEQIPDQAELDMNQPLTGESSPGNYMEGQ